MFLSIIVHLINMFSNLFSIFHLISIFLQFVFNFSLDKYVFPIFQSQIKFSSPALQLFSRITSPPFMISLAKLYFAKSKPISKNTPRSFHRLSIKDRNTFMYSFKQCCAQFPQEWLICLNHEVIF